MIKQLIKRSPKVKDLVDDCQSRLDFSDGYFDRILAIHILEHLPNLPEAVMKMHRLLNKKSGVFSVVIPSEGEIFYHLAGRISAQRIFKRLSKRPYKWYFKRNHINKPKEIFAEFDRYFHIVHRKFFPIPLSIVSFNLFIGITMVLLFNQKCLEY